MSKSPLIRQGGTTDGSVLRARDVERELQNVDVHPAVKSLLYRMAEIIHVHSMANAELALMLDKQMDIIYSMTTVAENMKAETDKLRNRSEADVSGDVTTETSN